MKTDGKQGWREDCELGSRRQKAGSRKQAEGRLWLVWVLEKGRL